MTCSHWLRSSPFGCAGSWDRAGGRVGLRHTLTHSLRQHHQQTPCFLKDLCGLVYVRRQEPVLDVSVQRPQPDRSLTALFDIEGVIHLLDRRKRLGNGFPPSHGVCTRQLPLSLANRSERDPVQHADELGRGSGQYRILHIGSQRFDSGDSLHTNYLEDSGSDLSREARKLRAKNTGRTGGFYRL